jgi:hypothetical protein
MAASVQAFLRFEMRGQPRPMRHPLVPQPTKGLGIGDLFDFEYLLYEP